MESPGAGVVRIVRALSVAVVTVGISLLGHVGGGGATPDPGALALVTMVTTLAVWAFSARPASTGRLTVILGAGQVGLHGAFQSLTSTGHVHHHHGGSPLAMVLGHAVACIVLAVLLTRADQILWRLWAWLSRTVRRLTTAPHGPVVLRRPVVTHLPVPARFHARRRVMGRAPPAAA